MVKNYEMKSKQDLSQRMRECIDFLPIAKSCTFSGPRCTLSCARNSRRRVPLHTAHCTLHRAHRFKFIISGPTTATDTHATATALPHTATTSFGMDAAGRPSATIIANFAQSDSYDPNEWTNAKPTIDYVHKYAIVLWIWTCVPSRHLSSTTLATVSKVNAQENRNLFIWKFVCENTRGFTWQSAPLCGTCIAKYVNLHLTFYYIIRARIS